MARLNLNPLLAVAVVAMLAGGFLGFVNAQPPAETPEPLPRGYLRVPGVSGESLDAGHAGDTDVLAWAWGVSNSGMGPPHFEKFRFTKRIDSTSPVFEGFVANGTFLSHANFTFVRSINGMQEFLVYRFQNVVFTHAGHTGEAEDAAEVIPGAMRADGRPRAYEPVERLVLDYQEVEVETRRANPDGSSGPPVRFQWDVVLSRPV